MISHALLGPLHELSTWYKICDILNQEESGLTVWSNFVTLFAEAVTLVSFRNEWWVKSTESHDKGKPKIDWSKRSRKQRANRDFKEDYDIF